MERDLGGGGEGRLAGRRRKKTVGTMAMKFTLRGSGGGKDFLLGEKGEVGGKKNGDEGKSFWVLRVPGERGR